MTGVANVFFLVTLISYSKKIRYLSVPGLWGQCTGTGSLDQLQADCVIWKDGILVGQVFSFCLSLLNLILCPVQFHDEWTFFNNNVRLHIQCISVYFLASTVLKNFDQKTVIEPIWSTFRLQKPPALQRAVKQENSHHFVLFLGSFLACLDLVLRHWFTI
jgi:hypothetical protein